MTARTFSLTVNPVAPPATTYTPTHYVTAAAVDGVGNGSLGNPWSLWDAMRFAVAGNKVRVAPGIYSGPYRGASSNWISTFYPANSGTAANPIVFFAEYPAATNRSTSSLWSQLRVTNPSNAAVMGSSVEAGGNHIVFDGFYANATYARPAPSHGAFVAHGRTGIKFRRIYYDYLGPTLDDDNYCAIFLQDAIDPEVRDCYITGNYGSGGHNASCITTYYVTNFRIENNTFYNFNSGVYVKVAYGNPQYGTIAYNRFESASRHACSFKDSSSQGVQFHHNLCINTTAYELDTGGSTNSNSVNSYNNTFVGAGPSFSAICIYENQAQYSGSHSVYNNIFADTTGTVANMWLRADGQTETFATHFARYTTLDYNVYYDSNGAATFNDATSRNFSGYRSQLTGYPAAVRETNSREATVTFDSNYKLVANGQQALTASNVGGPVGCYVTGSEEIGVRATPSYT